MWRSSFLLIGERSAAVLLLRRPVLVRCHRRVALGTFFVLKAFVPALRIVVFIACISLVHSLLVSPGRTLGKR
jgi:hypothetical protein